MSLQGGDAIPVYVTNNRSTEKGDAVPVYLVRGNRGIQGGSATPVVIVDGSKGIQGGDPIPVYIVDNPTRVEGGAAMPIYVVSGLNCSLCASPLAYISDLPALSARLLPDDDILARYTTPTYFSSFAQVNRSMLFTIADDGYPAGIPAAVTAILATAATYRVTTLSYNLEWPANSWANKLARLIAVRAEFDVQGNTLPIVFGPIFGDFYSYYAAAAPYCEGYGVQLQNAAAGMEGTWAIDCVAKARSVKTNPIMQFQLSCLGTNRTLQEIIDSARAVAMVDGVSSINLYIGGAVNWSLCDQVLTVLRPGV